ncbi:MAG: hypothetical protein MR384_06750 [Lachnospiraceae bacterium]|nr:hypothetical protein [Lachnospiraceae bacterium]
MAKLIHIKDAYFKIPEKSKDNFGCAITLLGLYLQRNHLTMDETNKSYDNTDILKFLNDDEQKCLLSCEVTEY